MRKRIFYVLFVTLFVSILIFSVGCTLVPEKNADRVTTASTIKTSATTVKADETKIVSTESSQIETQIKTVVVYFGNSNADKVVGEKRDIIIAEGVSLEEAVFDELIKGPVTEGLYPIIPKDTKLISVDVKDSICTLNLSQEFVDNHPGGSAGEGMTLTSIVNTMTELPGIEKVMFLIEGKVRDAFIHAVFNEPFERNEEMIQK